MSDQDLLRDSQDRTRGAVPNAGVGLRPNDTIATFLDGQATLMRLRPIIDKRGSLLPLGFSQLPFLPHHVFLIKDVPVGARGRSRNDGFRLLVRVAGSIRIEMQASDLVSQCVLDRTDAVLLIGPGVSTTHTYLEARAILLVLAASPCEPSEFLMDPG